MVQINVNQAMNIWMYRRARFRLCVFIQNSETCDASRLSTTKRC